MPSIEAAPARTVLLDVRDLRTHFFTEAGVIRAVDGVTLSIGEGETLAIVGESGSGKSVTGLTVMRLLGRTPARVVGGSVTYRGRDGRMRDLLELDERTMGDIRGNEIAMIFQDPMSSLNPVFTVGEQIAESIRFHLGKDRRDAQRRAVDLLAQVGISDPERRVRAYPHELSGGMRQRVMIALALACDPRLLIADEPTTALDVTIQAQIVDLLKRLQRERNMAMIFVTHDLKLVSEVADRVVELSDHIAAVAEVGDHDGGALGGQPPAVGQADSLGSAGDDDHPPVQYSHRVVLLLWLSVVVVSWASLAAVPLSSAPAPRPARRATCGRPG